MRYMIQVCRTGWLVYKGDERRWPVSHGHATRESAQAWVDEQLMIEDQLALMAEQGCAHPLGNVIPNL